MDAESTIAYRRALGTFATGVTVITAEDPEGPLGLTVNSFTSVSLEPRLILWCLGDESDRYETFSQADGFVVNVLGAEDRSRALRFAWGDFRIGQSELEIGHRGPRLKGSIAWLECETRERIRLGDHLAIVGEVVRYDVREGEGLLFFRGAYGAARSEET